MQPHVLLRRLAHGGFNLAIGAAGIRQVVTARVIREQGPDMQGVALRVRML